MPGLFIQRQAEALAEHCDVAVIYVHPDPDCPSELESDFCNERGVRVLRIYYRAGQHPSSLFFRLRDLWNFRRVHLKAFRSISGFEPDVIHAHILTRMGVIGWLAARKKRVPLVISEHWSRYLPGNGTYTGWLRKRITAFVTSRASALTAVSGLLRTAMQRCGIDHPLFAVIPNVVDTSHPGILACPAATASKTIVHISCFDDRSKNISGFLRSLSALSEKRSDFSCLLVGDGPDLDAMKDYAGSLGLAEPAVRFTGLQTGPELEEVLGSADFTVLSSRFETFGTVVIESLARGIPVVATTVGVADEEINEENGIRVPPGDDEAMTGALDRMLDRCRSYNREAIRNGIGDKFSAPVVARQLLGLYETVLMQRR